MIPVYMEVTTDRYELPVAVADSIYELARICGVHPTGIMHAVSNRDKRKPKKSKYQKVWINPDD